jgi:hypothetical protein
MTRVARRRRRRRLARPSRRRATDDADPAPTAIHTMPIPNTETPSMRLSHTLAGPLVAVLATLALVPSTALANAGGPPPAGVYAAPSPQAHIQRTGTPGPLWSYDYEAGVPSAAPARDQKATLTPATDDGATPWIAIAGGLGGACALLGAGAALTGRIRLRSAG